LHLHARWWKCQRSLCRAIDSIENSLKKNGYGYSHTEHLGYITTCPSNVGTGLRASVMLKLPKHHAASNRSLGSVPIYVPCAISTMTPRLCIHWQDHSIVAFGAVSMSSPVTRIAYCGFVPLLNLYCSSRTSGSIFTSSRSISNLSMYSSCLLLLHFSLFLTSSIFSRSHCRGCSWALLGILKLIKFSSCGIGC
jgi:hypothetical protein